MTNREKWGLVVVVLVGIGIGAVKIGGMRGAVANGQQQSRDEKEIVEAINKAIQERDLPGFENLLKENGAKIITFELDHSRFTALHRAAEKGLIDFVKVMLAAGADINARTFPERGYTPLYMAADGNQPDMVKFLLANKADPTLRCDADWTALNRAERNNNKEIVGILMAAEGKAEAFRLANAGDVAGLRKLLEKDPKAIHLKDPDSGMTLLHVAASQEKSDLLEFLLSRKIAVDSKDQSLNTPLHLAVKYGRIENVKRLLSHKANPNVKNDNDYTSLHLALRQNGSKELIRLLLKHGADPNIPGEYEHQYPALHVAAMGDDNHPVDAELIGMLLKAGADPRKTSEYGQTCMHFIAHYGVVSPQGTQVVDLLIGAGADINAKNQKGETPLAVTLKLWNPPDEDSRKFVAHLKSRQAK